MAAVIGNRLIFATGLLAFLDMVFPFVCCWHGIVPVMQRSGILKRLRSIVAALLGAESKSTFVFAPAKRTLLFSAAD
jgi:hypothetical protein